MKHHIKNIYRAICVVLCLILIFDPLLNTFAEDSGGMSASRAIIDFIEDNEGYSQYQYMDTYCPSIGYGTNCKDNEYPNGITREEAELLLLEYVYGVEEKLNEVMTKYNFTLTQNEFDALISLSYNIGTNWIGSSRLFTLIVRGDYELDDFINAFGIWCHVITTPYEALIRRRIKEINIYLYGYYQGKGDAYPPVPKIVWTIFDSQGASIDHDVQYYQYGEPYGSFPTYTINGQTYNSWRDENGTTYSIEDSATEDLTLYPAYGSDEPYHRRIQDYGEGENEYGSNEEYDGKDSTYYDELINVENWNNPFSDADSDAWYYKYVGALTKAEVVTGYPDGTFKPNGKLSCGEALKLILGAAELDGSAPTDKHWASGYYSLAINKGIISFIDIYSLDDKINRALVAKIVARSMGISASNDASPFTDTNDPYVVALYNAGILVGSTENGKLVYRPDSSLTRAEVCTIVWRMMTYGVNIRSSSGDVSLVSEGYSAAKKAGKFDYNGHVVAFDDSLEANTLQAGNFRKTSDNRIKSSQAYATGIDVSVWQGDIDWKAVKADGIDYAIIRVGYRGYTEGGIYVDSAFHNNISGAIAAGLEVGVYFYSQATDITEACEEAEFVLTQIKRYELAYPVVFDWEPISDTGSRTANYTTEQLTACAKAFCDTIESSGYKSAIYFNRSMGYLKYDLGALNDYDFWLAEYADMPTFIYHFDMWQYSGSATVDGIDGTVDINLCFTEYKKDWMA